MTVVRHFRKDLIQLAIVLSLVIDIARTQKSPTSPLLSALVPKIQQNNYELTPDGNKYHLRIEHPVGGFLDETVELKSPGTPEQELTVNGEINTLYVKYGLKLTVIYEADKNGYRARYKLEPVPLVDISVGTFSLSTQFLKSSVG